MRFLVGGAVLYGIVHRPWRATIARGSVAPVVVSAEDVTRMRREYERDTGQPATADDEAALVDKAIDEELLVREAFARGLDRHDRSIRSWLVEQMEVLGQGESANADALYAKALALGFDRTDLVVRRILLHKVGLLIAQTGARVPGDDVLRAFYERHRDEYRAPGLVTFWQVFFARATRGERAASDAEALLALARRTDLAPVDAARRGDAFPTAAHVVKQAFAQTEKLFGPAFARAVFELPERQWARPIASAFGAHAVWVEAREAGAVPDLDAVRGRLVARWQDERRRERVAALLAERRARTRLEVASEAWHRRRS